MSFSDAFKKLEINVMGLTEITTDSLTPRGVLAAVSRHEELYKLLENDAERYHAGLLMGELCQAHPVYSETLSQKFPALADEVGFAAKEGARRAALKDVRKQVEYASMLRYSINEAKAMSPRIATRTAYADASELHALVVDSPVTHFHTVSYTLTEMARKAEHNETYRNSLQSAWTKAVEMIKTAEVAEFLPISGDVPMESLPGARMVYNPNVGMAGAEIVNLDGSRICFGGAEAIERFAREQSLSEDDRACLLQLDSLLDIYEIRTPAPELAVTVQNRVDLAKFHSSVAMENCSQFFKAVIQGLQAGLDVNVSNGEALCQMSISADGLREGQGTPGVPFSDQWVRVASCKDRALSLSQFDLSMANRVAPQVAQAVADFKNVLDVTRGRSDSAEVTLARVDDGAFYAGEVVAVTGILALQSAGRGNFNLHYVAALDDSPSIGHSIEVRYKDGLGRVADKTVQREMVAGQGR